MNEFITKHIMSTATIEVIETTPGDSAGVAPAVAVPSAASTSAPAAAASTSAPALEKKEFATELAELMDKLSAEDVESMPIDVVNSLLHKINPYGRVSDAKGVVNLCFTNFTEKYWRNFTMTAMVGFLHRMCDEWLVPDGVPVVPVYEYIDDPSKLDTPQAIIDAGDKNAAADYEFARRMMEKKIAVKQFLEFFLQFNPDEHVRSAYRPNAADKSRKPIQTMAARLAVDHLRATDREFRTAEALANTGKDLVEVRKVLRAKNGEKRVITRMVTREEAAELVKSRSWENAERVSVHQTSPDATVADTVRDFIPPHDAFGRLRRYTEANYEALRSACDDLYAEKSDFLVAVQPISAHLADGADGQTPEQQAEAFKKKHAGEFITSVYTLKFGMWNVIEPVEAVRNSVNYYNDNTQILEEMTKRLEQDEKLGRDLMRKRVTKAKAKNTAQQGPDDPAFTAWRKQNKDLAKLGAEHIGDMVDSDVDDDVIEVPVWRASDGGRKFERHAFYTAAEAPTMPGGAAE